MSQTEMYLLDTNVISECRKRRKANIGVRNFFDTAITDEVPLYLSVITLGELRRGVELIRHRGDTRQAGQLETWLQVLVEDYGDKILEFTAQEAQVWGRLRLPNYENSIDKQIAATALCNDLVLVTRNVRDFEKTGASTMNPFR